MVVDQVNNDLSNWGFPATTDIGQRIAKTIVEEIQTQAGQLGQQHGTVQVDTNQSIDWMISYAVASVSQTDLGIVYIFGAALQM